MVTSDAVLPDEGKFVTGGDDLITLSGVTGSVSLSWTAPVARGDGTALALSEITGYTVYYGTTAENFPNSINVDHGSSTSATISNLPAGAYFMVVTTRDSNGRESGQSGLVTKQVQ